MFTTIQSRVASAIVSILVVAVMSYPVLSTAAGIVA